MILGITGSYGTGKSTVARIFKALGAELIDADALAHRVINTGTESYKKIVCLFGKGILAGKSRHISRDALGRIVFSNKKLLKELCSIIHPEVIKLIKARIRSSKFKVIVIDAPLLIEAELTGILDTLIVVKASRATQINRIMRKTNMKRLQIIKRINAQMPLDKKIALADLVIDNDGSRVDTKRQVLDIYKRIKK